MASVAKKPTKKSAKAAPKKPAKKATKPVSGQPAKAAKKTAAKSTPAAAKQAPARKAAPKKQAATAAAAPAKASKRAPAAKPEPKAGAPKAPPAPKQAPAKAAPKAAAKVVEAPKPKPKPKKSPFSPKDLVVIREQLLAQRAMLETEAADLNAGTFDASQSELSGEVAFDEEYADAGTFTFERERDLSLGNNIRDLVDRIDIALTKIDRGTYGICERCGEAIPRERMKALPYSVLCVRCKQIEERQR